MLAGAVAFTTRTIHSLQTRLCTLSNLPVYETNQGGTLSTFHLLFSRQVKTIPSNVIAYITHLIETHIFVSLGPVLVTRTSTPVWAPLPLCFFRNHLARFFLPCTRISYPLACLLWLESHYCWNHCVCERERELVVG